MKCTHGDHRKGQVERLEEEQNSEREMGHKFLQGESKEQQAYAQYTVPVCPCVNQDNRQSTKSIGYAPSRSRIVERLEPWRAARVSCRHLSVDHQVTPNNSRSDAMRHVRDAIVTVVQSLSG